MLVYLRKNKLRDTASMPRKGPFATFVKKRGGFLIGNTLKPERLLILEIRRRAGI